MKILMKQHTFRRKHRIKTAQFQKGALLIESMVALAVFSIALLSLSGMQLSASKGAFSSLLKTESMVASANILDKMRVNLTGVADGDYNIVDFGDDPADETTLGGGEAAEWLDQLATNSLLGANGQGRINCVGFNCQIQIRFSDARAEQGLTTDLTDDTDTTTRDDVLFTFDVNL